MSKKRISIITKSIFYAMLFFHFLLITDNCFSQGVAINVTGVAADNSAVLDLQSDTSTSTTSQGLLIPRMRTAKRPASPAEGLLIYNITTKCFEAFMNGVWQTISCGCSGSPSSVSASASTTSICLGSTLTLTGSAIGATSWWWTGPNYFVSPLQNPSITNITSAGAGVYTLTASNACGTATAVNTALINVNPILTASVLITVNPTGAICPGVSVTYTAAPTNGGTPTYKWKKGTEYITGETNSIFTCSTLANGDIITCEMTSNESCVTGSPVSSNGLTTLLNPLPNAPTATNATGVGSTRITANWGTVTDATSYQLDVSTINNFTSFVGTYNALNVGTALTYNLTGLTAGNTYYYRVRAVNSCGSGANSNTITTTTMNIALNLVSYWKLDESNGNAIDAVGSNTLTNTNVTYGTGKIINGAIADAATDILSIPDNTSLSITGALSMSMWVNFAALPPSPGTYSIFQQKYNNGQRSYQCLLANNDGTQDLNFTISVDAAGTYTPYIIYHWDTGLSTGTWYHLTFVYVPSTSMKIYLNGSEVASNTTNIISAIYDGTQSFGLLSQGVGGTNKIIDEFGIWNRALTAAEITTLYNSGAGLQYPF
ncbi:MAG: hypothetical protein HGB12_14175 [Bacteroidetes bacterium]|nr:hypothetical protein [Bacteroidota bacterium]